jgi:hypothetical protein
VQPYQELFIRAGSMIQVVEHLLLKSKTVSSNPSTTEKQKELLII